MDHFPRKRPTLSLSLFKTFSDSFSCSKPSKSPKTFDNGAIGLGIVTAITEDDTLYHLSFVSATARSPKSNPIPIVLSSNPETNFKLGLNLNTDELSESHSCLIENPVYFDDGVAVFNPFSYRKEFEVADYLNFCFLCKKDLHGLDIFMYRGEKGFCSSECREKHIRKDASKEKCGSKARKELDYSSETLMFFAGVAAA